MLNFAGKDSFLVFLAVSNIEMRKFTGGWKFGFVGVMNKAVHPFLNSVDDGLDFFGGAFQNQFNAAVGEIADKAGDVVAKRNIPGGISEPYSLDPAAEMTMATMDGRRIKNCFGHRVGQYIAPLLQNTRKIREFHIKFKCILSPP